MSYLPPRRSPSTAGYGGPEERTPILSLVSVASKVTSIEFELIKFIEASKANTEAQTILNKLLIEAIKGPENEHEKGLQWKVAEHEKTHKLFHYVWRALLVAAALTAAAFLGKIAIMVQGAKQFGP